MKDKEKTKEQLIEELEELRERVEALSESKNQEHKKAEERICEQAALLDLTQEAILVRDLDDTIIFWNKGAERLYGWPAKKAIGEDASKLLFKEPPPQLIEARRMVLEKGEWSGELSQVTKDGREITVESHWTLVLDTAGKPKSKLVVNTDITEKKKLAAQFLRAQRMESIGNLASGIAHDLNNALTPIIMASQFLGKNLRQEENQKLLSIIKTNVERSADMVKQVLSFARGVDGERVMIQPKHLITELRNVLQQTLTRSIQIKTFVTKDLWTMVGDATQLYQVLMNLCVNARDAMPQGGTLSIEAENILLDEHSARMYVDARPGRFILIKVTDTGKGIPLNIIDKIFEPFFTTKEIGEGTGLGLSTAMAIIKSHGGFINVSSEPGKGSQFRIFLPAKTLHTEQPKQRRYELPTGQGELILIVDDEASIREITETTLKSYGYKVISAGDGVEALGLYAKNMGEVKLVLMDMMMPYLDGPAAIRTLEKIDPNVKLITTSGLVTDVKVAESAGSSVRAFLPKPFTVERLLETISTVLSEEIVVSI